MGGMHTEAQVLFLSVEKVQEVNYVADDICLHCKEKRAGNLVPIKIQTESKNSNKLMALSQLRY